MLICFVTVIVNFPLDENPDVSMIAWTTTPWTLPSNLALVVNPDMDYVKVKGNYQIHINYSTCELCIRSYNSIASGMLYLVCRICDLVVIKKKHLILMVLMY